MSPGPYPSYKPSGVPWLGDVPMHWELVPNRLLLQFKKDVVGDKADNYTLLSLTKRGVIARDMENAVGKFPSSFDTYQAVGPGDLIFCLFDIDETPRTVGLSRLSGMLTGAYTRFICADETTREFLFLLYLSMDNGKLLKPLYSGLRKVIPKSTFLSAKVALPPLPEQHAIVRYLNHADRRIRRYISAKRKLIALLEEEKQAVINRAVTRGLDLDVRLKPSGVEWLGDVPEHWEVVALKFLSERIQNGSTPPTIEPRYYEDGTIPWYGPSSCTSRGEVGAPVRYLAQDAFSVGAARMIHGPALLIVVIGTVGRMALLQTSGSTNQQITSFALNSNLVHPVFVLEQAGCAEHWLRATASTATIPILDADVISRLSVACPPIEEQNGIVEYLNNTTPAIDAAIARTRGQIELLQEYRTRLIADVVTGKLDVREAAALLPDDPEDEDPIDEDNLLTEDTYEDSHDPDVAAEELAMESEVTI